MFCLDVEVDVLVWSVLLDVFFFFFSLTLDTAS